MGNANQLNTTRGNEPSKTIAGGGRGRNGAWDRVRSVMFGGKRHNLSAGHVLFDQISDAGWIRITAIGNENLYFRCRDDSGEELEGYCKCL